MATTISNYATLSFTSGGEPMTISSTIATVTMQGTTEISKRALEAAYKINDTLTYTIVVINNGDNALTNIEIEDDLGTYAISETVNVTPLTYVGPANRYVNDVFAEAMTPIISADRDLITFQIAELPAGASTLIQYLVRTNEYAPTGGAVIDNIASLTSTELTIPVVATWEISLDNYTQIVVDKIMTPDTVVSGGPISYHFDIYNYGTIPANAASLRDAFTTQPTIDTVTVDGTVTTDYSDTGGVFLYPANPATSAYTIPAAVFSRDIATGALSVTPGRSTIDLVGTI